MISSSSQHKIHRLVPRRKVKAGSLADISRGRGEKNVAAIETMPVEGRAGSTSLSATTGAGSTNAISNECGAIHLTPRISHQHEVTPDKSPKPQMQDESSSSESESDESTTHPAQSERSRLISEIDITKLSPGLDPDSLSNYELLRLRNIQRNEAKLASLGLVGVTTKTKKKPKQPPKKIIAAKNSPYVAPTHKQIQWNAWYQQLRDFHKKNGHIMVPNKFSKQLQSWKRRQMDFYEKYKEGKGELEEEKVELLEKLGFQECWLEKKNKNRNALNALQRELSRLQSPKWMGGLDGSANKRAGSLKNDLAVAKRDNASQACKSNTALQRELSRLESPKWMAGSSNNGVRGAAKKRAMSTPKDRGRGLKSVFADEGALMQNDSSKTSYSTEKRKSERLMDDYSTEDGDSVKYKAATTRGSASKSSKSTKQRKAHRLTEKYAENDDSSDFDNTKHRNKLANRGVANEDRRSKRRGQRMRGEYSDEETSKIRRGSAEAATSNNYRKVEEYSDDSDHSDASRGRSRTYTKSKSSRKRGGRYLAKEYSDNEDGSVEYETEQKLSTKKRGGRLVIDYSDGDDAARGRARPSSRSGLLKEERSGNVSRGHSRRETFSDDGASVEYEERRGRRKSNKNKATTGSCGRRELPDNYYTEDSSCSSAEYTSTSKRHVQLRNTRSSKKRSETKRTGASKDEHGKQQPCRTSTKRKRVIRAVSINLSKRQKKSPDTYRSHNYHDSESAESQTLGSSSSTSQISSASTKSSSLYHTAKPVNEVVITQTQTLTTQNRRNEQRVSLEIQRTKLIEEYAYLYSRNLVIMEKMPRMLHELRNMQAALIENGSTLVDKVEGPMELMKKEQALWMLKSSFMNDSYGGIVSSVPVLAAPPNAYDAAHHLNIEEDYS